jgi:protein-disulfide isomerase/uncharacterized membrane protein
MRRLNGFLVLAGLALSAYLLHRHFALMAGAGGGGVCSNVLHLDCDAALTSPLADFAGLPLAGWGIVHFGVLAALWLLAEPAGEPFATAARRAAFALVIAGGAAGVALSVAMATGAAPFCPLCALVHAVDLSLVAALTLQSGLGFRCLLRDVAAVAADVARAAPDAAMRTARTAFLAVGLVALVLWQTVFLLSARHETKPPDPRIAAGAFAMRVRYEIPADERDVRIGPADAPIRLVVFTDFECSACKRFAERLSAMAGRKNGQVSVVLKHFPACRSCNPSLSEDRHPNACSSARAAEAARLQGRFREYHDALFASAQPHGDEDLVRIAREMGLDAARFAADRAGGETARKVADDVELAARLGVDETPCVFMNGRRVPDIAPMTIFACMNSELASRTSLKPGRRPADERAAESPPPDGSR